MPRAVIAGCGYIGEPLADSLHSAGWNVEGWTASAKSAARLHGKPYRVRSHDIGDENAAFTGEAADVVVQCVSPRGDDAADYERVYFRGAQNLARWFPGTVLLFTSSTGVYAQRGGEWVTEESAAEPQRESARVLRRTEQFVMSKGGIVLRFGGIYGPDRAPLLQKFLRNQPIRAEGDDYFINHLHRDDAVAALRWLLERLAAVAGEIFNVTDDQPMRSRDCYKSLAALLARPLPPTADTAPQRARGPANKRVSNAKLRATGWRPRYPTFQEGMAESVLPSWTL